MVMQTSSNRIGFRISWVLGIALALGASLAARADDVRRHCVLDWSVKAPADAAKISQGDLYDRLRYSTGATPFTYSSVYDDTAEFSLPDGTVCTPYPIKVVTDEPVEFAALRTTRTVPFVRFSQPVYEDSSNVSYLRSQQIELPGSQVASVHTNELSIVMRLRWQGIVGGKYWSHIFSYGWTWGAGQGVCTDIGGAGATYSGYPALVVGNSTVTFESIMLYTNRWYDVAYTIRQFMDGETRKTVLSAYTCTFPGTAKSDRNWIVSACITNTTLPALSFSGGRNRLSAQDAQNLKVKTADERHFRGDIQRVAVYSKELTADEVRQAFTGESEEISLGVRNAKSGEFSKAAADTYDADAMAWHQFRRSLDRGSPSVIIKKKLDSRWAAKTHVLRFGILPDENRTSQHAYLKISVNDIRIGRVKLGPDGTNFCVCLPAGIMARALPDPENDLMSLKIERDPQIGFDGNVEFDYLSVGGPWQIGKVDNSQEEFGANSDKGIFIRYHVAAWDDTKIARSTYSESDGHAPQKIYFTLSAEEAAKLAFSFCYRSCSVARWKLVVNGIDYDTRFWDANASRFTNYSWNFPAGTFSEGLNCIEIAVPMYLGIKQWNNHDAFWFSVSDFYPGSLYTGPLGLGFMLNIQ